MKLLFFMNNFWDKKIDEGYYNSSVVKINKKGRRGSMIHSGMTSDTAARTLLRDNEVFAHYSIRCSLMEKKT